MSECFRYYLVYGLGGGPVFNGEYVSVWKVLFSMFYTFFMVWIVVAIVSGIIIDNLGELRDTREQIKADLEGTCFICNISNDVFEDIEEDGFKKHCERDHNVWNYLGFFIYITQQ